MGNRHGLEPMGIISHARPSPTALAQYRSRSLYAYVRRQPAGKSARHGSTRSERRSRFRILHAGVTLGSLVAWKLHAWSPMGGMLLAPWRSYGGWVRSYDISFLECDRSYQFGAWIGTLITPIQPLFAVAWVVRRIRKVSAGHRTGNG